MSDHRIKVIVTHVHVQDPEGSNRHLYELEPVYYTDLENFELPKGSTLEVVDVSDASS